METLWGGTFHFDGKSRLRRYSDVLRLPERFSHHGPEDPPSDHNGHNRHPEWNRKKIDFQKLKSSSSQLDAFEHTRKPLSPISEQEYGYLPRLIAGLKAIEKPVRYRKRDANAMDFDEFSWRFRLKPSSITRSSRKPAKGDSSSFRR